MAVIPKPYSQINQMDEKTANLGSLASPNQTTNPDGTVTIDFSNEEEMKDTATTEEDEETGFYDNLVEELEEDELLKLAEDTITNAESDEASRSDWLRTIEFGFDLLGVKVEEKNTPFEGACSAQHPLLMESAVKFQSKASNELLPAQGPAKVKILGDVTLEKEEQGNRVKNHMNYQLTEEMTEFYPDSERLLLSVPLIGSGFKKTYYNTYLGRPCSEFVPGDQLIVPNSSPDLERADRYTHVLYKTDYMMEADCESGFYKKPKDGLGIPSTPKLSNVQKKTHELTGVTIGLGERDKVYTLYEQHIMLHIPALEENKSEYKIASPYIVTVDIASRKVLGIRRGWKEGDTKRRKKSIFTHYGFVPSFNFYHFGFLHLLGNLQLTLTSCLRSLVDAGQFATLQGGFKLKGVRIVDDGTPIRPGQFKEIETAVMDINKAIMRLPFGEPSNVLFQMLQFVDAKGQKFADSTEQVIADSTNYGPVGTTMALLEASTKFFSAIHKRLHASLKNELKIIAEINSETLEDDCDYNAGNETMRITKKDYGPLIAVVPVSDPNISSSAHRMAKAQALYEMAVRTPEVHDMREVLKHVYTNMDYVNIDKILPPPDEAQPQDPLSDLQLVVQGKPIKAFPGQDHQSHIQLKTAFIQDPLSGSNPMMQKAATQVQANIQEHMMLNFVEQIQGMLAQQAPQGQVPQEAQGQIEAQAAQKISQMNVQKLQQQVESNKSNSTKDQATMMLAQAEVMDSQTQLKKVELDAQIAQAQVKLKELELQIKNREIDAKVHMAEQKHVADREKIATQTGMNAMVTGMQESYAHNTRMKEATHQGEIDKEVNRAKPVPPKKTT